MPKVQEKKKNKAGKPYTCSGCAEKIKPGEQYYTWSFRYGGTYRQHTSHGYPKPSQLTQSKMSGAYSAIEDAETAIDNAEDTDAIKDALETCASEIESVRDEYQEGLDNLPDSLRDSQTETQEKINSLESFKDSVENAGNDVEEFGEEEPDEPLRKDFKDDEAYDKANTAWTTAHPSWEEARDAHLEEQKGNATGVLEEFDQ